MAVFNSTPNLPTNIIPTNITWLKLSGKFPVGLGIPPVQIKIVLESNPLKSTMLLGRLGVFRQPLKRLPRGVAFTGPIWNYMWYLLCANIFANYDDPWREEKCMKWMRIRQVASASRCPFTGPRPPLHRTRLEVYVLYRETCKELFWVRA